MLSSTVSINERASAAACSCCFKAVMSRRIASMRPPGSGSQWTSTQRPSVPSPPDPLPLLARPGSSAHDDPHGHAFLDRGKAGRSDLAVLDDLPASTHSSSVWNTLPKTSPGTLFMTWNGRLANSIVAGFVAIQRRTLVQHMPWSSTSAQVQVPCACSVASCAWRSSISRSRNSVTSRCRISRLPSGRGIQRTSR